MSLGIISGADVKAYWEGATHVHLVQPGEVFTFPDNGTSQQEPAGQVVYYDRLDRCFGVEGIGGDLTCMFWDPLLLDNSVSGVGAVDVNGAVDTTQWVGEWDLQANTQRYYTALVDSSNDPIQERSPVNFGVIDTDTYPEIGTIQHRTKISTQDGFWRSHNTDLPGAPALRTGGGFIFFESLGYCIKATTQVRQNGVTTEGNLAQIDLVTGDATIITDIPQIYRNVPDANQAPPFAGSEFYWTTMQFARDRDSVPLAPKGRLIFFSDNVAGVVANERFRYIAVYDWNPLLVVGGSPNRVHKRLRFITRLAWLDNTAISTLGGITANAGLGNFPHFYHPPTDTFRLQTTDRNAPLGTPTNITADRVASLVWSGQPVVFDVTKPTELRRVVTNARIDFSSDTIGDLGEQISGVEVNYTLERNSTFSENLGTSDGNLGATAGDFTLGNVPLDIIDDVIKITAGSNGDQDLDTEYTAIATGTASSGNEVEVNLTNGDLQFFVGGVATDLANGDIVLATYNHFQVDASPPHGTLLTTATRSDAQGQVFTQVEYADDDDLENMWDKLTVVEA